MVEGAASLLGKVVAWIVKNWRHVRAACDRYPCRATIVLWAGALGANHLLFDTDIGAQLQRGATSIECLLSPTLATVGSTVLLWRRQRVLRLDAALLRVTWLVAMALGVGYFGWYAYASGWKVQSAHVLLVLVALGAASGQPPRFRHLLVSVFAMAFVASVVLALPRRTELTPLRFFCPRTVELANLNQPEGDLRYLNHGCRATLDLTGARLSHAKLSHANLAHASLIRADLTRAELQGADLSDADLEMTHLACANLSDSVLTHVQPKAACLRGAVLEGASLSLAATPDQKAPRLDLSCANLTGATISDLPSADLTRVTANRAEFRGSLYDADLSGGNFRTASFSRRTTAAAAGARLIDGARGSDKTLLPAGVTVLCSCVTSGPPGSSTLPNVIPGKTNCADRGCPGREPDACPTKEEACDRSVCD
jgi:uncharacterized protein YjbI with pentapeptide repeats